MVTWSEVLHGSMMFYVMRLNLARLYQEYKMARISGGFSTIIHELAMERHESVRSVDSSTIKKEMRTRISGKCTDKKKVV